MATSSTLPALGVVAPPDLPPEQILVIGREAEAADLDDVWLWEDCFATSGIAPAAALLAATSRVNVGIGLMPAPLRAPSLTAMEIATLARMFPGRFRPGLGHGVSEWMAQAGVAPASPLTLLREHVTAITALLDGRTVTGDGMYVSLTDVTLRWPPAQVPGLLVGGRGPRTLALAGELAAGVILDDVAPGGEPDVERLQQAVGAVRTARSDADRDGEPDVVAIVPVHLGTSAAQLHDRLATLGRHGVTTVAAVAVEPDGPPVGDDRILTLIGRLGRLDDA